MHLITLAALLSGGAASVIHTAVNPFVSGPLERRQAVNPFSVVPLERRLEEAPSETCGSYTTVTVTPAVITVTSSEFTTTTAETITTTEVSLTESTQDATDVVTVTEFESSTVTETTTAETVTETEVITQRRKKRGCAYKTPSSYPAPQTTHSIPPSQHYSSSVYPISVTSSSATATTSSASASSSSASVTSSSSSSPTVICTITVTAPVLFTTTTETIVGSATATATETVTSLIIATTTVTVSTTDVITTLISTTVPVTATSVVTVVANPTPTFVLQAVGGSVDGQYLIITAGSSDFDFITFTSDSTSAKSFYIADNGVLAPTSSDRFAYYSNAVGSSSYILVTTESFATSQGGETTSCQLSGSATIGSTGSLTCPNGGSSLNLFSVIQGRLNVQTSSGTGDVISLQYTVIS